MNKFFFFILTLAIALGYVFEVDQMIARSFNPFESIKKFYIENATSVQNSVEKYFKQITTINELREENKELKSYKLLYEASNNQLNTILDTIKKPNSTTEQIQFTRVLSYINFDDFTKVWLDFEKKDDKILGIISDGYSAGIAVNENGKTKALLNGNEKCNYAIFVGDEKAPGIIHPSKSAHTIVAKFIPIWYNIKVGDEVITSGMDNIFFEGLKVGKVTRIKKLQDMQEATIEPYAKVLKQKYFFIYSKQEKKEKITKKEESDKKETASKQP